MKPATGSQLQPNSYSQGYIALVALLIIATAGLTIGLAVSLAGMNEIQAGYAVSQDAKAESAAQTCVEDGLERLRQSFTSYTGSLSIGSNSCIISILVSGTTATVNATGTADVYNHKIQAQVDNQLNVNTWQEE